MSTSRPILFSGPMVRAIIEGRKTQTRRVIKPQPIHVDGGVPYRAPKPNEPTDAVFLPCRYGKRGDTLWVRETWMRFERTPTTEYNCETRKRRVIGYLPGGYAYRADLDNCGQVPVTENGVTVLRTPKDPWRPSIHMPREASRLTLLITGVRVERLQHISGRDAVAEGWPPTINSFNYPAALEWFRCLWVDINGAESWAANPWVFAITFEVQK